VAYGLRKKPLDFRGNPVHITLCGDTTIISIGQLVTRHLFNSNNIGTSVEVALLSAILIQNATARNVRSMHQLLVTAQHPVYKM